MRIALCSRELAPYTGGGIGAYTAGMARVLAAAGHEVHVLTQAHPGLVERDGAVTLHAVHPSAEEQRIHHQELRHAFALARTLGGLGSFDLIEFPEFGAEGVAALLAREAGTGFLEPLLVVRLHTPNMEIREADRDDRLDLHLATLDQAEEVAMRRADLLLAPTEFILDRVRSRLPGAPPAAVVRHPFPVASEPRRGEETPGSMRVVFTGRLQRLKGVETLVRAGVRLLETGVDVVFEFHGGDTPTAPGGGSMQAHLEALTGSHRARFHFHGQSPHAVALEAVRGATLCCFPSEWDNLSTACLEAMAAGQPVVVSDAGGMREIVEDGRTGLVVPAGDAAALAAALSRLLADPALRARLGEAAQVQVEREFSARAVLEAFSRAVEQARASRRPGPEAAGLAPVTVVVLGASEPQRTEATLRSIEQQSRPPLDRFVLAAGPAALPPGWSAAAAGAGSRLTRALALGEGEWVLLIHGGTTLRPTALARVIGAAQPGADAVLVCSHTPGGALVPLLPDPDLLAYRDLTVAGAPVLLRRSTLVTLAAGERGAVPEEDWQLAYRLTGLGVRLVPEFLAELDRDPERPEPARTARVLRRHAASVKDPSRPLRMLHAELGEAGEAPLRHRLVDALNARLRRLRPLHRAVKRLLR